MPIRSISVCSTTDGTEQRLPLPERTGDVWHGRIPGLTPGARYGLRAQGPYRPEAGLRFNVNKLLLDPYAKQITGHPDWDDALMGHTVGHEAGDLSFDPRDSAPFMPRAIVVDPGFAWPHGHRPDIPMDRTLIYEAHAKGLTAEFPGITDPGLFLGLASDPVIEHLTQLNVTAVELLPVHAFLNDRFLVQKGLVNYWGYQTLGFFAPDPRYLSAGAGLGVSAYGGPAPRRRDRGAARCGV